MDLGQGVEPGRVPGTKPSGQALKVNWEVAPQPYELPFAPRPGNRDGPGPANTLDYAKNLVAPTADLSPPRLAGIAPLELDFRLLLGRSGRGSFYGCFELTH